jgi:EmrB/QacA subfamily drug resistance transporter
VGVVYVAAMFMAIMDITIVNVALPTIGREFGVAPTDVDAVVTSFLVSLAVFIPASGWLGDRFGTKRILLLAIAIFTIASVLCGQAHSLGELVAFRVLQGVGGGMLTPVGFAMLLRTYPPSERIHASRILVIPTAFAPALGPVLGGLLVTQLSWRWVFYVNLPIGIAAFVFGLLTLQEHREPNPGRFDAPGFVLAGAGFASIMYAVSEGPSKGWGSTVIVLTGIGGAVLLGLLVLVELRTREPLLDLHLLTNRLFASTAGVFFVAAAAFLGTLYAVALFYQDGLGLSALQSGLSTFPEAIGVMIGAQVAARLYSHIGPRRLMAVGEYTVALTIGLMALANFGTTLWYMRGLMLVLGFAMAHVFVPAQTAAFATMPGASMGRASGMFNADRQLGGAVGVAVLTTVMAAVGVTHEVHGVVTSNLNAFHAAFLCAAALALVGGSCALFIHDADAAATMTHRREPVPERGIVERVEVPTP